MAQDPFETEDFVEKRNRLKRERDSADLKKVISMVEGRRLVWRYLDAMYAFGETFDTNALAMANNSALHDVGMRFFREITPEIFCQMQNEKKSEARAEKLQHGKELEIND